MDVVADKALQAVKQTGMKKLVMAGGVAANSRLRTKLSELCRRRGIDLYRPRPGLCTDNGAMVACAAYYKYKSGQTGSLEMDASPSMPL